MKMKLAVSNCLLGVNCNYSACHNKDDFVVNELSKFFEFIPFCPEVMMLGTPRETIRFIIQDNKEIVIGNATAKDYTQDLQNISQELVDAIVQDGDLCGFIFKAKSPSCGIERVKVYTAKGGIERMRAGIMADIVLCQHPVIPIEDNQRLIDPWLRENFIMQIFAFADFENFKKNNPKIGDLVAFHTSYKFLIMSKGTRFYQELGRVVGNHSGVEFQEILAVYEKRFKEILQLKNSKKKSFNTLLHLYGFVKQKIDQNEKIAILEEMEDFRNGFIPLIAPLNLLMMFAKKYNITYLQQQKFLNPYPKELRLRSTIAAYK